MVHYLVDPREPADALIREAAGVIRRGGIVAYPTETMYGLGVDPRSDEAVQKLFDLKDRETASAIALIASDAAQAEEAGHFSAIEKHLATLFWPGPLTIVVPASATMSPRLHAGTATLGVRVSAHPVARALAERFGGCITATSANLSGRPAAFTAAEVAAMLGDRVDVLLDAGPAPGGPPSTVVEIVEGVPTLHRAGAVAWDRVLESLQ